jgi:hypothetical protein
MPALDNLSSKPMRAGPGCCIPVRSLTTALMVEAAEVAEIFQ